MPADPFGPARLGPVQLRNRVLKAATFEGMSPANVVSGSLVDFHRRFAAGGVAMTTVSYVAVSPDGRGAPNEIYIHDQAADGLARIAAAVHAEGAAISAQLGHAGAIGTIRKRYLGPSRGRTLASQTWWPGSRPATPSRAAAFTAISASRASSRGPAACSTTPDPLHVVS